MTDEQIIKALKHCFINENCEGCPLFVDDGGDCLKEVGIAALDLINRQKAEIERLKSHSNYKVWTVRDKALVLTETLEDYEEFKRNIESEAIKEFAERLKAIFNSGIRVYDRRCSVGGVLHNIDNLVAEMTDGKDINVPAK